MHPSSPLALPPVRRPCPPRRLPGSGRGLPRRPAHRRGQLLALRATRERRSHRGQLPSPIARRIQIQSVGCQRNPGKLLDSALHCGISRKSARGPPAGVRASDNALLVCRTIKLDTNALTVKQGQGKLGPAVPLGKASAGRHRRSPNSVLDPHMASRTLRQQL